ncbi:VOC family protein [Litoribacter alkaliphilus]|uniref:VOC family protein n=1 Tax=Litoribacter ruber TaxID=702568 RepID=A0AAP2CKA1_9BACT|nr:VOC family protein [Litoribacter alkaliphilus]MBS9523347.1 VOC family protein [Litoribacter alkaliphilus]
MTQYNPFHLAFPIRDIEETRKFYQELLGCEIGRSTDKWIDFNFFGHQLSAHVKPEELQQAKSNEVDGKNVPVRHFGAILEWDAWHELADKLKAHGIDFIIEPYIRFKGEVGEQATMFFLDPSGNALEFKAFQDREQIFAK